MDADGFPGGVVATGQGAAHLGDGKERSEGRLAVQFPGGRDLTDGLAADLRSPDVHDELESAILAAHNVDAHLPRGAEGPQAETVEPVALPLRSGERLGVLIPFALGVAGADSGLFEVVGRRLLAPLALHSHASHFRQAGLPDGEGRLLGRGRNPPRGRHRFGGGLRWQGLERKGLPLLQVGIAGRGRPRGPPAEREVILLDDEARIRGALAGAVGAVLVVLRMAVVEVRKGLAVVLGRTVLLVEHRHFSAPLLLAALGTRLGRIGPSRCLVAQKHVHRSTEFGHHGVPERGDSVASERVPAGCVHLVGLHLEYLPFWRGARRPHREGPIPAGSGPGLTGRPTTGWRIAQGSEVAVMHTLWSAQLLEPDSGMPVDQVVMPIPYAEPRSGVKNTGLVSWTSRRACLGQRGRVQTSESLMDDSHFPLRENGLYFGRPYRKSFSKVSGKCISVAIPSSR
ncbi:hypothetical protein D3C86_1267680 [compost metagenome]